MKMRNLYSKIFAAALALFAVAACARDAVTEVEQYGELDLGSITSSVVEAGVIEAGDPGTRAVSTSNFVVSLWRKDAEGEVAAGSWPLSQCNGTVKLLVGKYRLEVAAPGLQPAAWESPWYVGRVADFAITKDAVANVGTVECKLGNIKVTVRYSEELQALLSGSVKTTVTIGEGTLEYPRSERRGGYFSTGDDGDTTTMIVSFEGTVDGKYVNGIIGEVEGVTAGEWERVRITTTEVDGHRTFHVTVFNSEAGQIGDGDEWFS